MIYAPGYFFESVSRLLRFRNINYHSNIFFVINKAFSSYYSRNEKYLRPIECRYSDLT